MGYIYKIINQVNGKMYIGQTTLSIKERWKSHNNSWKLFNDCRALYAAFDKYGIENFEIEQVEECSNEEIDEREQFWIQKYDTYNNGYNLTLGGSGSRVFDQDLIRKLWDEGLTVSEIAEKIGSTRACVRKNLVDYENYTIEESRHRGGKHKGITNGKPVKQFSLQGDFLEIFPNAVVAAESIGLGRAESTNIRSCAKGLRKSAYGYRWVYVD